MAHEMIVSAIAAIALGCLPLASGSQAQDPVYPSLEEPRHRVIFHNAQIDVYDVHLMPGEQSAYHRHVRDQLGIVLRTAVSSSQIQGAAPTVTNSLRGTVSYIPHSTGAGFTHRVSAPYGRETRVIGIEFAARAPAGAVRSVAPPDQSMMTFPQGSLRRVSIPPGRSREIAGDLVVAMSAGVLDVPAGPDIWRFDEGGIKWIASRRMRYRNAGSDDVSLLVLRLNETPR